MRKAVVEARRPAVTTIKSIGRNDDNWVNVNPCERTNDIVGIDAISSLPLAKLRYEEKAMKFAGIQFASIGVNIGLNLFFMLVLFNPEQPEEGVLFILIANLIASLVKPLFLYKDFLQLRFNIDIDLAKEMIVYALPLVIAGFAGIINETLDRILLKQLLYFK